MKNHSLMKKLFFAPAAIAGVALLASCTSGTPHSDPTEKPEQSGDHSDHISAPITITYDGGIYVLDGESLDVKKDIPLDGFNRVSPAGDSTHVAVSRPTGFEFLNAVEGEMTDITFPGEKPGHVIVHAGKTVLFTDSNGQVEIFDSEDLANGQPETQIYTSEEAHHGVSVELDDGTLITTLGNAEGRPGAIALDKERNEIARSEECPGIHGEAVSEGEVVAFGCRDGVLLFKQGKFVKISGSADYSATATQSGSEESSILLGDYKVDADAEREFPIQFALIDTVDETITVVPMPNEASYSFRSFGRGPHGEAFILATDGNLHVIDAEAGTISESWPIVAEWKEPMDWQVARPSLFARDHDIYITEPASNKVLRVDSETGAILAEVTLDNAPNEISGVTEIHSH